MRRGGKFVATSTVSVGLAILIAAAVAGREGIVERYHLYRLQSSDEEARLNAAEALAARKCIRAVPYLVRLMLDDEREIAQVVTPGIGLVAMTPLAHALPRMGEPALPALLAELEKVAGSAGKLANKTRTLDTLVNAIRWPELRVTRMSHELSSEPWIR